MKRDNGAQVSPCTIAKVRDSFLGANNFNRNQKKCSKVYWEEVCDKLGTLLNKSSEKIHNAKMNFRLYN
jgi:hypothetical protein